MNLIASLVRHPASTLVAVVVAVLLVRFSVRLLQRKGRDSVPGAASEAWSGYASSFFSGVLFTNALAHFSHGISGEEFPAPFGFALGRGFTEHLSNVLWGFLNLVLGYSLFVRGKVSDRVLRKKILFFAGVLAMGVFLSFVFSH
jgi:cytochrome c biogenesis protein CcdA